MKLVALLMGFTFLTSVAYAQGGASTVGDGGHGVGCKGQRNLLLLDLFEFAGDKIVSLSEEQPAKESFPVLLNRATILLNLAPSERELLRYAASQFFRFRLDPWALNLQYYQHFLVPKEPMITASVWHELGKKRCRISPVAIRPDPSATSIRTYESLCSMSHAQVHYCFLVDERLYRRLSRPHQACLVLHEVLRYLPDSKRLSESKLRETTARICTQ